MKLVAAGKPIDVEGYDMVPLRPSGTVEKRVVKVVAGEKAGKKSPALAKASQPTSVDAAASLPTRFQELARLASSSADIAEGELEAAFYQGFDLDATSCTQAIEVEPAVEEPAQPSQAEPSDKAPPKQAKKGKGQNKVSQEEDLDAILSELGVEVGAKSPDTKKSKKGKK
mmetsp:Transcript_11459/g.20912  ORF Transcript_11459/g.20912 Transcript_11459/m.20912 type:complete len:170 (-) Transcript_11459:176-685(-)